MKIRVLIVDDEPLARERVGTYLARENDITVVGEAKNGPEAIALMRELRPDIVFLDVQMPGTTGIDALRELRPQERPLVVFVTAYDKYAVEAFEVHAVDYLLKPVKESRFKEAVTRARASLKKGDGEPQRRTDALLDGAKLFLSRIPVRRNGRVTFVTVKEISHVEASGNYLTLHVGAETHMLRETLTGLEAQLSPKNFVRISRSAIVNVNAIKEIQPTTAGDHAMLLRSGVSLPVTRPIRELEELLRFS